MCALGEAKRKVWDVEHVCVFVIVLFFLLCSIIGIENCDACVDFRSAR